MSEAHEAYAAASKAIVDATRSRAFKDGPVTAQIAIAKSLLAVAATLAAVGHVQL